MSALRYDNRPCRVPGQECPGTVRLQRERWDDHSKVFVGWLACDVCGADYLDTCKVSRLEQPPLFQGAP